MIVLDTNVISEVFRSSPDERVVAWLKELTGEVAITAVTLAELLAGIRRLPDGRRKTELTTRVEDAVEPFRGSRSILPFDEAAAALYAEVLLARETAGRPISTGDAQIAAICLAYGATCATRDFGAFTLTGVDLVDPWESDTPR